MKTTPDNTLKIKYPPWAKSLLYPSRYKGAHGGRGSGKSHFFAELMIGHHVADRDTNSLCGREIQKSLSQSVKKLLEDKIQALNLGRLFEVQESKIRRVGGNGLIIFQGLQNHTAESIKSLEGYDRAWIEEAQALSQLSLDLLRPTLRKANSELWFSWNPRHKTDPVDVLLRGANPPPASSVVQVNYMDNPLFPEVLREEMEYDKRRDIDKYRHIWLGEYIQRSSSRVFSNWRIEDFDTDPNAMLRFGADWGFASDPTVLVRLYITGRTIYVDHEAYRVGCEIIDTPDLFMSVPQAEKWPMIADSARPETISHMRQHGFPKIQAAVKGPRSVEEGVEWLKSFDIVVHPRCVHTIDELTHYSYKVDTLTDEVLPVLADRDNHVIDALRYACESARRAQKAAPPVKSQPIPTANRW